MTLPEYIAKHGKEKCARKWGVSLRTVEYWFAGETLPRRSKLPHIIKTTGLTHAELYAGLAAKD